jgi:hypothetical protein
MKAVFRSGLIWIPLGRLPIGKVVITVLLPASITLSSPDASLVTYTRVLDPVLEIRLHEVISKAQERKTMRRRVRILSRVSDFTKAA